MGAETKIEWADHTFNPWVGCTKVSAGCKNCYAEVDNPARIARGQGLELWGVDAARKGKAGSGWKEPERWFRAAVRDGVRRRVFCASQGDVFEDRRDLDAHRERLWELIERTAGALAGSEGWEHAARHTSRDCVEPIVCSGTADGCDCPCHVGGLDWLLLTKRPQHVLSMIPDRWRAGLPPNFWIGASVENQEAADARIPHLLRVPARVRFLSLEPLLGPVDLDPPTCPTCGGHDHVIGDDGATPFCREHEDEMAFSAWLNPCADMDHAGINWLIIGGESGRGARPCDVAWVRDLVRQGRDAGVPVFVKQLGARPVFRAAPLPSDVPLRHPKGGDPAEWPEDLRVREVPHVG